MPSKELATELALASFIVQDHVKRIERELRAAVDEIVRLQGVIADHTRTASGHLVSNTDVDVVSVVDIGQLRTCVRATPKHYEFYLAQPLGGWSEDHKQAFHKQVVKEFANREADKIARSIWTAEEK